MSVDRAVGVDRARDAELTVVAAGDDLDLAVEHAIDACFHRTTNPATPAERLLVHAEIHDAFVAKLTARTLHLHPQPLTDETALDHVVDHVDDAWTHGAAITQHHPHTGLHYPPTILTGVTADMKTATTGTHGPIAPIIKLEGPER